MLSEDGRKVVEMGEGNLFVCYERWGNKIRWLACVFCREDAFPFGTNTWLCSFLSERVRTANLIYLTEFQQRTAMFFSNNHIIYDSPFLPNGIDAF